MLTDASLSLSEGILSAWIEKCGEQGFMIAPDYALALVREVRAYRAAACEK